MFFSKIPQSTGKVRSVQFQLGKIHLSEVRGENVSPGMYTNSQEGAWMWRHSRQNEVYSNQCNHRIGSDERLCVSRRLYKLCIGAKTWSNQTNHINRSTVAESFEENANGGSWTKRFTAFSVAKFWTTQNKHYILRLENEADSMAYRMAILARVKF